MSIILAIDAGTTSVRTIAFDDAGRVRASAQVEFPQYFPRPGWVEHDAEEIWSATQATLRSVTAEIAEPVAAIGIANQRETIVAWRRSTSELLHRALVWQDQRGADRCSRWRDAGLLATVRERTGLVIDPYFSASKLAWLFDEGGVAPSPDVAVGTIDTWLLWQLTGGAVHATDATNASRTMLLDIDTLSWDLELCDAFAIPVGTLPTVHPSSGPFGVTVAEAACGAGIPVTAMAGDQHAALFGQAAFNPGDTKNTYGTGSFVMMNAGPERPGTTDGLLTTIGWALGSLRPADVTYAIEGSIFSTGSAVQWLRDGLGIIDSADEVEALARQCDDADGVVMVPAFTGLGSPWWDPTARATIMGITRGTGGPHIARAVIEAMVHQTRDVVDAMTAASGRRITRLRVDGGASAMDTMLAMCADHLGVVVQRPVVTETTALGAAMLAGLGVGLWNSIDDVGRLWTLDAEFAPTSASRADIDAAHRRWLDAVERSRGWIGPPVR